MFLSCIRKILIILLVTFLTIIIVIPGYAQEDEKIAGVVYHDINKNGVYDSGEPGIPGILVSNGSDIVQTDNSGNYEIEVDDNTIVFVIKPSDWKMQVNANNIPQFFTIKSSSGTDGDVYQGLNPTGDWPESVDFPLYQSEETDEFRVLVFGDTQPRTIEEVNYIAHDSVQEVIGADAAFGTTLGDLVFDDLNLFEPLNQVIGQIGIPWRHVMGNHDIDFSANTNWDVRGTYLRTYGPSWYAFSYGSSNFVVVDNIRWIVEGEDRTYQTGLGEKQMMFINNFLKTVPEDELVVFLTHIPWVDSTPWADVRERQQLFDLIASHSNSITLAAHTHRHYHRFIGEKDGFYGKEDHHMISMATVCGAWWEGAHDEYGIPHSLMQDGTPIGYGFLEIDDNDWKFSFKAARRPADFQMHVYAPDEIRTSEIVNNEVYTNIFNALPDATVQMKVGKNGKWMTMSRTQEPDPFYEAMKEREDALDDVTWLRVGDANPTPHHLWKSKLPEDLEPGTYSVFIRANDRWHNFEGKRIIRIVE